MRDFIITLIVGIPFVLFFTYACEDDYREEEYKLRDMMLALNKKRFEGCRDCRITFLNIYEETDSTYKFAYTFKAKDAYYGNEFGFDCEGVCDKSCNLICDDRCHVLR